MTPLEKIVARINKRFPTERAAEDFLYKVVWERGDPWCPRCGSLSVSSFRHRSGEKSNIAYKCSSKVCGHGFTTQSQTPFKGMRTPLRSLFALVEYLMSNPAISVREVSTMTGGSFRHTYNLLGKMQGQVKRFQARRPKG